MKFILFALIMIVILTGVSVAATTYNDCLIYGNCKPPNIIRSFFSYNNIALTNQSNNFNRNNLTNITEIRFNNLGNVACPLTLNGTICRNNSGIYIISGTGV